MPKVGGGGREERGGGISNEAPAAAKGGEDDAKGAPVVAKEEGEKVGKRDPPARLFFFPGRPPLFPLLLPHPTAEEKDRKKPGDQPILWAGCPSDCPEAEGDSIFV